MWRHDRRIKDTRAGKEMPHVRKKAAKFSGLYTRHRKDILYALSKVSQLIQLMQHVFGLESTEVMD